jgi:putative acetyltransferase
MALITITPFQTNDQADVKQLILDGLVEHWGFLDPTKNPDLDDIAAFYAGATFLVAWMEGRIVGTGALLPRSKEVAEIVRMSVIKENRRQGIGRRILQALVAQARVQGFKRVVLETTASWDEVIEFYLRFGFHITHSQGGDVFFQMELL